MTTEIASAVDSVPVGCLRLVRPSSVTPSRSSRKIVTTRRISSAAVGTAGSASAAPSSPTRRATMAISSSAVGRQRQHDRVEPAAQRARQLVDAAVAVVGRGDQVEALHRGDLGVELGDRQHLLGQDRDERVLHLRRHAGQLLDAHQAAGAHRPVHRARHERRLARALGEQAGVVPAVAQRLLGRAGGALHEQRRVAADRRREVLADPRLGRAGDAEQQQGAVGGQRGDGDLHQPALPDVLRGDRRAVGQHAAEQVGDDRPRRQLPARWARPVVGGGQRGQLVGVRLLGVRAQDRADRRSSASISASSSSSMCGAGRGEVGERVAQPGEREREVVGRAERGGQRARSASGRTRATKLTSTARWVRSNVPLRRPPTTAGTTASGPAPQQRQQVGRHGEAGQRVVDAGRRPALDARAQLGLLLEQPGGDADRRCAARTGAGASASVRWRRSSPTRTSGGRRQPRRSTTASHSSSSTGHAGMLRRQRRAAAGGSSGRSSGAGGASGGAGGSGPQTGPPRRDAAADGRQHPRRRRSARPCRRRRRRARPAAAPAARGGRCRAARP